MPGSAPVKDLVVWMRRFSRDTRLLARTAIGIGISAVAAAFVLSFLPWPEARSHPESDVLAVRRLVMEQGMRGEELLLHAAMALGTTTLGDVTSSYLHAILNMESDESGRESLALAVEQDPPVRYAQLLLGDLKVLNGDLEDGLRLYEREALLPGGDYAFAAVAQALRWAGEKERLRARLKDPEFRRGLDQSERLRAATYLRDPVETARAVLRYDYTGVAWHVLLLTVVSAAVWFTILWKLFGIQGAAAVAGWGGTGVVLGVVSASLTLFAVIWQEEVWGFVQTGELVNDLVVCICGIGLREETIKLLCFLPLLPWLRRCGRGSVAVFAASCTGLGFALQENLGYLGQAYGEGSAWSRFLTANFLHLALTGLLGFAAYRFTIAPAREWERLLGTFLAVVVAHGLYNAFQIIPVFLQYDFPIFSIIVLAGVAQAYFTLASHQREFQRQTVSVLGVFVLGGALLLWLSLALMGWRYGFLEGIQNFGAVFLAVFPVIFLFVRQFRDA